MKKPAKEPFAWFKWLRRVVVATTVVAVGIGLYVGSSAFFDAERWPINVVKVTGQLRYTDSVEFENIVIDQVSGGFFGLDMNRLQESAEGLEWVADVDARRVWRDTLLLDVNEHVPFARWGESELISLEGVVYASDKRSRFDALPLLLGTLERKHQVMANYKRWSGQLNDVGLSLIVVELDSRGAWELKLKSGTYLKLGTVKAQQRLDRFSSVYKQHFASVERELDVVDLRYTNGIAVTWGNTDV